MNNKETKNLNEMNNAHSAAHIISQSADTANAQTMNEEMRVAYVSDSDSFGKAFSKARAQVGAGGMFKWRGNVYGTYYKNEWDSMSRSERENFQLRMNNQEISDAAHDDTGVVETATSIHHDTVVHDEQNTVHADNNVETSDTTTLQPTSTQLVDDTPVDSVASTDVSNAVDAEPEVAEQPVEEYQMPEETPFASEESQQNYTDYTAEYDEQDVVQTDSAETEEDTSLPFSTELVDDTIYDNYHVIEAASMQFINGESHNVVVIGDNDDQALLVDLNDDGEYDVLIHDDNGSGYVSNDEWHDISKQHITTYEVNAQLEAKNNQSMLGTSNDDLPDYISNNENTSVHLENEDTPGEVATIKEDLSDNMSNTNDGITQLDMENNTSESDTSNDGMLDYINNADTGNYV